MMSQQDSTNEISILSITFTDDIYRGEYEAISKIDDKQFIHRASAINIPC